MCEDGIAGAQRLNQGRVGATDLVAMYIEACEEAQGLHHGLVVDGADEQDFRRCCRHHGLLIGVAALVLAQDHQAHAARLPRPGPHDFENGVFWLGAGDQYGVAAGLQAMTGQQRGIRSQHGVSAIGDGADLVGAHPGVEMPLDFRVVGHQVVAEHTASPVVEPEPHLGDRAPLLPPPLDAVHVDDVAPALEAVQRAEERGVVAQCQHESW